MRQFYLQRNHIYPLRFRNNPRKSYQTWVGIICCGKKHFTLSPTRCNEYGNWSFWLDKYKNVTQTELFSNMSNLLLTELYKPRYKIIQLFDSSDLGWHTNDKKLRLWAEFRFHSRLSNQWHYFVSNIVILKSLQI